MGWNYQLDYILRSTPSNPHSTLSSGPEQPPQHSGVLLRRQGAEEVVSFGCCFCLSPFSPMSCLFFNPSYLRCIWKISLFQIDYRGIDHQTFGYLAGSEARDESNHEFVEVAELANFAAELEWNFAVPEKLALWHLFLFEKEFFEDVNCAIALKVMIHYHKWTSLLLCEFAFFLCFKFTYVQVRIQEKNPDLKKKEDRSFCGGKIWYHLQGTPCRGFLSRSSTRRWMMGLAVLALPFMVNAPVHAERWGEGWVCGRRSKRVAGFIVIMTAEKSWKMKLISITVGGLGSEGDKTVLLGPKNWNPISSSQWTVLARHG